MDRLDENKSNKEIKSDGVPSNKVSPEIPTIVLSDSFQVMECADHDIHTKNVNCIKAHNACESANEKNISNYFIEPGTGQKEPMSNDCSNLLNCVINKQFDSGQSCDSAYDSSVETPVKNMFEDGNGNNGNHRENCNDNAFLPVVSGVDFLKVHSDGMSGSSLASSCSSLLSESSTDRPTSPSTDRPTSPSSNVPTSTECNVNESNALQIHRDILIRKLSSSSSCSLRYLIIVFKTCV